MCPDTSSSPRVVSAGRAGAARGLRILIAEDDPTSGVLLASLLSGQGRCHTVEDGLKACQAFRRAWADGRPFDLICLDVWMPAMDGQEALQTIRQWEIDRGLPADRRAKIIMVTGLADPANVRWAFDRGCEAYVTKPVQPAELQKAIRSLGLPGRGR